MVAQPFAGEPVKLAVIGLGYVGLPLAVAFAAEHDVIGFDIDQSRVKELRAGADRTLEVPADELASAEHLKFSADEQDLSGCNVFIVTVPTPIDEHKRPDLAALLAASRTVGGAIGKGGVVIYESTVYPGATEEDCIPIVEARSSLVFNTDFFAGYSPERANPGDPEHRFCNIVKVTSGSTPEAAKFIDELYRRVVKAGTHRASSIRVAEAAKVIENTQRDLNIALINEFALIFRRMGLDTIEVLEAAGTKWNFLGFRPGLVGGHCIGVDPYYLTYKAQALGYHPEVILAGRRINDGMGAYIARELVKAMIGSGKRVKESRVLIMGLSFKENTPDLRNTRVVDIVSELSEYEVMVDVWDPWISAEDAAHEYGLKLIGSPSEGVYDGIVLAVPHREFAKMSPQTIRSFGKEDVTLYDVKCLLPKEEVHLRL